MTEELKSCPFCGVKTNIAEMWYGISFAYKIDGAHDDECPFFYMTWTIFFDTPEEAAKVWNRRVSDEKTDNT